MIRSLRARLIIWQVLLLTVVIAGFGVFVYFLWRQNLITEVDTELLGTARVLEGTLRGYGRDTRPPRPRNNGSKKDEQGSDRKGPPPKRNSGKRKFSSPFSDIEQRSAKDTTNVVSILAGDVPPSVFELPHALLLRPGPRRPPIYFAVFDSNGNVVGKSDERRFPVPDRPARIVDFRIAGTEREVVQMGPGNTRILVGRDIKDVFGKLNSFLAILLCAGFAILVGGSLGGYWLTGRAIAPIKQVSKTAQSISATNLSERIDTSQMDSEFVHLSRLLNEMLGRLEETIEQQRRFIADASHEFRTPISVLGLHSELALSQERTPAEYRKTIEICLRASKRLESLTSDLLTLAKSDAGQIGLAMESVDLCELGRAAIEFLQPLAEQHKVSINLNSSANVTCQGDRRLLRQLVDNLLTNAIIHNREGGKATINIDRDETAAIVRITDDGPGIPAEKIPHLFERFYRVNESRSRESGGSGLGLSICKSIAELHRGKLVAINNDSEGATFELRLPANRK